MSAEDKLMGLLERIFADEIVDVGERTELRAFQQSGALDAARIEAVFVRFVEKRWGEAMADDRLTGREALLLSRILDELELPVARVPMQLRMALKNH
jgi:hypothetical protein